MQRKWRASYNEKMRQRRKRVEEKTKKTGVYVITKNKIWKEAYRAKGRRQWELGGQDNGKEQPEIEAKESKEEGNIRMRTNLESPERKENEKEQKNRRGFIDNSNNNVRRWTSTSRRTKGR